MPKRTTNLPSRGTQVLVIDPNSAFFGKVMTTLSDPVCLKAEQIVDYFKPGDVVNDLDVNVNEKGEKYWIAGYSHLLVPIPPPAKARRMFGREDLGVAA